MPQTVTWDKRTKDYLEKLDTDTKFKSEVDKVFPNDTTIYQCTNVNTLLLKNDINKDFNEVFLAREQKIKTDNNEYYIYRDESRNILSGNNRCIIIKCAAYFTEDANKNKIIIASRLDTRHNKDEEKLKSGGGGGDTNTQAFSDFIETIIQKVTLNSIKISDSELHTYSSEFKNLMKETISSDFSGDFVNASTNYIEFEYDINDGNIKEYLNKIIEFTVTFSIIFNKNINEIYYSKNLTIGKEKTFDKDHRVQQADEGGVEAKAAEDKAKAAMAAAEAEVKTKAAGGEAGEAAAQVGDSDGDSDSGSGSSSSSSGSSGGSSSDGEAKAAEASEAVEGAKKELEKAEKELEKETNKLQRISDFINENLQKTNTGQTSGDSDINILDAKVNSANEEIIIIQKFISEQRNGTSGYPDINNLKENVKAVKEAVKAVKAAAVAAAANKVKEDGAEVNTLTGEQDGELLKKRVDNEKQGGSEITGGKRKLTRKQLNIMTLTELKQLHKVNKIKMNNNRTIKALINNYIKNYKKKIISKTKIGR